MNSGNVVKEKKKTQSDQHDFMSKTLVSADKELRQFGVMKSHISNLDEYDTLSPGPSHSVLRSSSSLPPRTKGLRVTFQKEYSNSFQKTKPFCRMLNLNAPPLLWRTDQQSLSTLSTPEIRSLYLDSEPTEGTNKPQDMNFKDVVLSRTSLSHDLAEKDTELESHTDRLLRLTRELYDVTHLPDTAIQFFEMTQEERSSIQRLCMNSLLHPDQQETQQAPKHQLKTKEPVIFPQAQGSSVPGPALQSYGPDVCTILRTLLDLVDEHWNGQSSLHFNPNFMAKAILLLLPLTNPVPLPQPEDKKLQGSKNEQKGNQKSREWWDVEKDRLENKQGGHGEWKNCREHQSACDVSQLRQLNRQLAKTQHEQELLKTRLISALKENFILRAEKMKIITSLESDTTLLDFRVHLNRETQVLQQQDKLLKQLKQTLHLLQDNHRSLVSRNDMLHNLIKRSSKCSKSV